MTRRRIARLAALACLATSGLVGFTPAPSSAEKPQAVGWWSRTLPMQAEAQADERAGTDRTAEVGEVTGLSGGAPVRFHSAAAPRQDLPTDPTLPVPGGEGGPATTVPLPVPVPTVPPLPVPLPEDPGPGVPNPTVPDGGLWVANDPTGAVAMSAIRYRGDIGAGELSLRFAPGSTNVGPMVACPMLSEFQPVEGGAWKDRPAHDCDRLSLTGRRSADGTAMLFSIPQGFLPFGERVLDIVIMPAPGRGDPFSVYFEAPDAESLQVTQGQELPAPIPELPEPDPFTLPTIAPDSTSFDSTMPTFSDVPTEVPEVETTDDSEEVASSTPIADLLEPFTESRTGRIIAVAVLLAMGAGLWLFGGQEVRHPRLLGALAGDAPAIVDLSAFGAGRGIGRFRRERAAPPNRL